MPAPIAAVDCPEQCVRRARAGGMGARADDAHIALEHVEELRQFVDTGFADDRSAARYPLVADRKSTRLNVTNAHLVCRFLLEKKKTTKSTQIPRRRHIRLTIQHSRTQVTNAANKE